MHHRSGKKGIHQGGLRPTKRKTRRVPTVVGTCILPCKWGAGSVVVGAGHPKHRKLSNIGFFTPGLFSQPQLDLPETKKKISEQRLCVKFLLSLLRRIVRNCKSSETHAPSFLSGFCKPEAFSHPQQSRLRCFADSRELAQAKYLGTAAPTRFCVSVRSPKT